MSPDNNSDEYKYYIRTPNGFELYTDDKALVVSLVKVKVRKPTKPTKPTESKESLTEKIFPKPEPIGVHTTRTGTKNPVFEHRTKYVVQFANSQRAITKARIDKVNKFIRKSGDFLSCKDIQEGLGYKTYAQVTTALIVLQVLGKIKRYKKGRGSLYKTTFSMPPPIVHGPKENVIVVNKEEQELMDKEKEESRKQAQAKTAW